MKKVISSGEPPSILEFAQKELERAGRYGEAKVVKREIRNRRRIAAQLEKAEKWGTALLCIAGGLLVGYVVVWLLIEYMNL